MAVRACYQGRLRQEDLARAIGVHQSKVSKWATGSMRPSLDEISAMEDACDRARGFVLALTGHATEAGLEEALAALASTGTNERLAAERGGTADLSSVVRRSRTRPRPGATRRTREDA